MKPPGELHLFKPVAVLVALVILAGVAMTWVRRPVLVVEQRGYRGTGMVELYDRPTQQALLAANALPATLPPTGPIGPPAGAIYQNVQVLKNLSVGEFTRLMASITTWVAPQQGCAYCHNTDDMGSDALYTKVVARRMIEMVQTINTAWTPHVAATGVTCYTCHRGQPVPANIWFNNPGPKQARGQAQAPTGRDHPAPLAGLTALPYDPLTPYLQQGKVIRVAGSTALPTGSQQTIRQTEGTYALMMHFSDALGVNCTYCHNTRSFGDWDQSTPQRAVAWHGIRMVGTINTSFLEPLTAKFPASRLGQTGDAPKVNCQTASKSFQVTASKSFQLVRLISAVFHAV